MLSRRPELLTVAAPSVSPVLEVVTGPHDGERVELGEGDVTVGRDPDCDLVLDRDIYVSGKHLLLRHDTTGIHVRDCSGRRATALNEQTLPQDIEHRVNPGDQLTVGKSTLTLVVPPGWNSTLSTRQGMPTAAPGK